MLDFFEKINIRKVLKYLLFMALTLLLQNTLLAQLRIFGVCPLVLPAAAVAVGMFEGPVWGACFGILMGIFGDMAFVEQNVLFTVVLPGLAFASAFISQVFVNRRMFAFLGLALGAAFITALVQMVGTASKDSFSSAMVAVAVLQTLLSILPAPLLYMPPAKWIK